MSDGLYQFDRKKLETYLQSHIDGFGDLQEMTKFSDGQSNPTYKLVSSTGDYVLRAKPPGKLLGSAHQVDREFRVMQALTVTKVPVPEMFHLSGDDSPLGVMFFVMKFVDGRILWDPALPKATVSERGQYFDAMNTALADRKSTRLNSSHVVTSYAVFCLKKKKPHLTPPPPPPQTTTSQHTYAQPE